jgi:ribosomal-protein-alanine N-acetyltransferase
MRNYPERTAPIARNVSIIIERMTLDDIAEVMDIEQVAFPLPWPAQAYRQELQNFGRSYFIVARAIPNGNGQHETPARTGLLQRIVQRKPRRALPDRPVVGYGGLWVVADDGHISTIATHRDWRGKGVGELLLLSMLREAQRRNAAVATLEVRVSNTVAQALYRKYRFDEVGLRKHYYRDNGEDAMIMEVISFTTPEYRAYLDELESKLMARLHDGD